MISKTNPKAYLGLPRTGWYSSYIGASDHDLTDKENENTFWSSTAESSYGYGDAYYAYTWTDEKWISGE